MERGGHQRTCAMTRTKRSQHAHLSIHFLLHTCPKVLLEFQRPNACTRHSYIIRSPFPDRLLTLDGIGYFMGGLWGSEFAWVCLRLTSAQLCVRRSSYTSSSTGFDFVISKRFLAHKVAQTRTAGMSVYTPNCGVFQLYHHHCSGQR